MSYAEMEVLVDTDAAASRHPLERLLIPLHPPALTETGGHVSRPRTGIHAISVGEPVWLSRGNWRIYARAAPTSGDGEEFATFHRANGGNLRATHDRANGTVTIPFGLADAYVNYVSERWQHQAGNRKLSAWQLSLFYRVKRLIPRRVQLAARRGLVRWQGRPDFPCWPLDDSVNRLVRFYARSALLVAGRDTAPFRWFWPTPYTAAATLTHDVESAEGLRLAADVADLEEARGLRSSFNVVADWYPIDHGILRELRGRGFEIGVHGVHHDRSMFASRESFEAQQPRVRQAVEEFEAEGFRSPATHRVFDWLSELPVSYDSSIPHSDPYEPQPGGCCTLWPFFVGRLVELPWTLPQDHTLFTLLRGSAHTWVEQFEKISRLHGLTEVLSHPDPGYLAEPRHRSGYVDLLDRIAARPDVWAALPRDIARWWRARDQGDDSGGWSFGTGVMQASDDPPGAELQPGFEADAAVGPVEV